MGRCKGLVLADTDYALNQLTGFEFGFEEADCDLAALESRQVAHLINSKPT